MLLKNKYILMEISGKDNKNENKESQINIINNIKSFHIYRYIFSHLTKIKNYIL